MAGGLSGAYLGSHKFKLTTVRYILSAVLCIAAVKLILMVLKDLYNREFKTLRVSLLSRCNLSCVYCTMGEDEVKENNQHQHPASAETLLQQIQQLHSILNLETIRLTGGEPLLYHELVPLIKGIQQMGIP